MSPKEAFKVGFMLRCADEGLAPGDVEDRIQKAAGLMQKQGIFDNALGHIGGALGTAGMMGLAAPIALGGLGGYFLNKTREANVDEEDVRTRELISELRTLAHRAKTQQKAKQLGLGL